MSYCFFLYEEHQGTFVPYHVSAPSRTVQVPDIARSVSAGQMFPVRGYLDAADPVPLVVQGVLLARLQ